MFLLESEFAHFPQSNGDIHATTGHTKVRISGMYALNTSSTRWSHHVTHSEKQCCVHMTASVTSLYIVSPIHYTV